MKKREEREEGREKEERKANEEIALGIHYNSPFPLKKKHSLHCYAKSLTPVIFSTATCRVTKRIPSSEMKRCLSVRVFDYKNIRNNNPVAATVIVVAVVVTTAIVVVAVAVTALLLQLCQHEV